LLLPLALLHALAENITYDVPLLPLLAVAGGCGLAFLLSLLRFSLRPIGPWLLIALVCLVSFWPLQEVYRGQGEHEESHQNIQRIARYIREHSDPSDAIFTPELSIALEAQRPSLPGTELGRFFYFPEFSTSEAKRRGVMNNEMLQQTITSRQAKFIVISNAHLWNGVSHYAEDQQIIFDLIEGSGYQLVHPLHTFLPNIEMIHVYERI
jgi:hypothetical protein